MNMLSIHLGCTRPRLCWSPKQGTCYLYHQLHLTPYFAGPKPEGIFYTPSSGIWQSVWLESVPSTRIADSSNGTIIRSDDIESGELHALVSVLGKRAGHKYSVELEASFAGYVVATTPRAQLPDTKRIALNLNIRLSREHIESLPDTILQNAPLNNSMAWLNGIALWSPEHPQLYDLSLKLFDDSGTKIDEVKMTTGMRSVNWTTGDGTFRLNGHPYFQALLLDQGYWHDTLMTPPSPDALKKDIEMSKEMGFNGCRKHQKVRRSPSETTTNSPRWGFRPRYHGESSNLATTQIYAEESLRGR
jgi:hypothetical protein